MKYDTLYPQVPDQEVQLRERLSQRNHDFQPFQIPIQQAHYQLKGFVCRRKRAQENQYFFSQRQDKNLVVLHFTAGYLAGDIPTLVHDKVNNHVSTNYLLGRDGGLYQLFSSAQWAYHLGRTAIGGNTFNSQRSVAIEVSNVGPLSRVGDTLRDFYGNDYCRLSDTDAYQQLAEPYRGYSYYATYTDRQYEELTILLRYLATVYDIPLTFLPAAERFERFATSDIARSYRGIASHVNFRSDKFDIGPAFDWSRLIQGVQAYRFSPQYRVQTRSLMLPPCYSVEKLETEIARHMPGARAGDEAMDEEGQESFDATVGQVPPVPEEG